MVQCVAKAPQNAFSNGNKCVAIGHNEETIY